MNADKERDTGKISIGGHFWHTIIEFMNRKGQVQHLPVIMMVGLVNKFNLLAKV